MFVILFLFNDENLLIIGLLSHFLTQALVAVYLQCQILKLNYSQEKIYAASYGEATVPLTTYLRF